MARNSQDPNEHHGQLALRLYTRYWLLGRFVQHFYGDMALSQEGSFLSALRERVHLPQELRDYAAWIQASVASSSRLVAVPTPQRRTRPPLPPLTALKLKANVAPCAPTTAFTVRAPDVPMEAFRTLRRAQSSGQVERRSHPPLTKYPLRRSILIWKPVAWHGLAWLAHVSSDVVQVTEVELQNGTLQAKRAHTTPL